MPAEVFSVLPAETISVLPAGVFSVLPAETFSVLPAEVSVSFESSVVSSSGLSVGLPASSGLSVGLPPSSGLPSVLPVPSWPSDKVSSTVCAVVVLPWSSSAWAVTIMVLRANRHTTVQINIRIAWPSLVSFCLAFICSPPWCFCSGKKRSNQDSSVLLLLYSSICRRILRAASISAASCPEVRVICMSWAARS